jgi:hypothetical protein
MALSSPKQIPATPRGEQKYIFFKITDFTWGTLEYCILERYLYS